jgi:ankyrin repeat protein
MTRNPIRRTGLVLLTLSLLLPLSPLSAEDQKDLRELLRDALYTEEVSRDPEAAAKQYEALLSQHDAQRAFAASALFRLAEVRRKQDRKDEAIALYQKLLARFPEAETEAKLAQENLVAMGAKAPPAGAPAEDEEIRELRRLQHHVESSPDRLKDPELVLSAVRAGHLRSIDFLLAAGAAAEPWQLLEEAVKSGNLRTVTQLLDYPFKGHRGLDSALFLAITLEYSDVTKLLIARGANPNSQGMYRISENVDPPSKTLARMTPLHVAVRKRDLALCKLLLEHKADPNLLPDFLQPPGLSRETMPGRPTGTPLHDAVVSSLEITRLLLERGADPKVASPQSGFTPLHSAVRPSHLVGDEPEVQRQILKLLIEKGADLEAKTTGAPQDPSSRNASTLQNANVPPGTTPLMAAVLWESPAAARCLIGAGASPSDPNLLDHTIKTRQLELVRLFVASPDKPAISPDVFHEAVQTEDAGIIRLLVEAGADPSTRSPKYQTTPLKFAAGRSGSSDLLQLLIELGAKPEPEWLDRNFEGATTWHLPLLYHRFLVPRLQERDAVTLVTPDFGPSISPHELVARQGDDPPLPLAPLLLRQRMSWPCMATNTGDGFPMRVTIFRKNDGQTKPVTMRLNDDEEFPPLKWGDVIELSPDWDALGGKMDYNIVFRSEIPSRARWHLMKRVSFPVNVEIDGKARELTVRGDRLIFDPGTEVVPLVGATGLANLLRQYEVSQKGLPNPVTTVVRKGWPDIQVPWNLDHDFPLEPGDKVIIKSPPPPKDLLERRKGHVAIVGAGVPFCHLYGESYRLDRGRDLSPEDVFIQSSVPTLIQAVASLTGWWAEQVHGPLEGPMSLLDQSNASSRLVPLKLLPHPDYSKIVIRRLKDDGKEERIPVDLAAIISAAAPDLPAEAARKADIPLRWGDIVEIPQIAGRAGTPWKGPSPEEGRFFAKALDCRVQVVVRGGAIELREVHYEPPRFVEMAGQWIPVAPTTGTSSLTAAAALGQGGDQIKVTRQGAGAAESGMPESLFLRDGDAFEVTNPGQPRGAAAPVPAGRPRPPRQRMVPPVPNR